MAEYKVKDGVVMEGLQQPILDAIPIIANIYKRHNTTLVITAGRDAADGGAA